MKNTRESLRRRLSPFWLVLWLALILAASTLSRDAPPSAGNELTWSD